MAATALMGNAPAVTADVTLPCPAFKPGNSWESTMTTPMGPTMISTSVLSTDGKTILVGEKTTARIVIPGLPDSGTPMTNSVESEYTNNGPVTVRNSITTNGMRSLFEPPEPICGTLPSQWTVTTKSTVSGMTTLTHSTVTARSLGKEKITVPAGTFDTTVIEIRRQDQPGAPSGSGMSGGGSVQIIHAVENVGFVTVMVTNTMPHIAGAQKNVIVAELQSFVIK
jgi:hypothetical protein